MQIELNRFCAHLIILLPPLGLLSTALELLLNYTGILKVLLLSTDESGKKRTSYITDLVTHLPTTMQ